MVAPGFVYLAGPYRGKTARAHDWTVYCEIEVHINEARRWAAKLATDGIPYFCPHLNSAHMEVIAPLAQPDYWLAMDLVILRHASALMLLPDWRDSTGTRAEKEFAKAHGIQVYTTTLYEQFLENWKEHYDGTPNP